MGLKIIIGIFVSSFIIGLLFYFFLYSNPLKIYEANTLKWVPVLSTVIGLYVSGRINKDTPTKFLPFLFLPLIIFKVFNYAYFPFILILFVTGVLTLLVTRNNENFKYNKLGWIGAIAIFLFFLFSQPLILKNQNFGYDDDGELVNANIIWSFKEKTDFELPSHVLFDKNNNEFDLADIKGEIYLITFWATWCGPCMQEKPELEKFKSEFANDDDLKFIDVSFDNDKKKWLRYIENKGPLGQQLISGNPQNTSREFNFIGIPMHVVVNADGTYKKFHSLETAKKVVTNAIR